MKRILIVEDDKGLREGIELALKREAFSFEEMQVKKGEEEIILSKTELKLLQLLVENKNRILTREKLIDRIWTEGAEFVDENALSVTVNRLRGKLHENGEGHLQTVYGKGYVWKA